MKKQTLVIFMLAVLVVSCLSLTACHKHEFGQWTVVSNATCTDAGLKERTCECGVKETEVIPATGHTAGDWVTDVDSSCIQTGVKHQVCSTCDAILDINSIPLVGHTFGEWTVVLPATCTEQGLELRFCPCGASQSQVVDALGHDEVTCSAKSPTCTSIGWNEYVTCSRCDYSTYQEISATAHIFDDWTVVNVATCTENGLELGFCSCGAMQTQAIPALGHTYIDTVVAATCTSQGYTLHTCSVCGDNYKDTYIETNGVHNFQEGEACEYCGLNIADVAVANYNMSATVDDNIRGYVVPRMDGKYDVYIKGTGAMKDYGASLFYEDNYAKSIVNVYINDNVTSIASYTFSGCDSFTSITIPEGVTSIGEGAFTDCDSLTSITIPSSVTSIGRHAFLSCSKLGSITIEGSPQIGVEAFSLTKYYQNFDNWENRVLYIGNCLIEAKTVIETCIIREGTTVIADEAFGGCGSLTSITIPEGVKSISEYAFHFCTSLTSITIPSSVTSIVYGALLECHSLTNVYYAGTEGQWNNISIGTYNSYYLTNATIHYNYTGE